MVQLIRLTLLSLAIAGCSGGGGSDDPVETNTGDTAGSPTPLAENNCNASIGSANAVLDQDGKEYLLCRHNQTRAEVAEGFYVASAGRLPIATDMQRQTWDPALAEVAQAWANQCRFEHNPDRSSEYQALGGEGYVGENIATSSLSPLGLSGPYGVEGLYQSWIDEAAYWEFGDLDVSDACHQEPCGHFTQVIWADSGKVGCAVAQCPGGLANLAQFKNMLVCNYSTGGNYIGASPYTPGDAPCQNPAPGQTACENGLTRFPDKDYSP